MRWQYHRACWKKCGPLKGLLEKDSETWLTLLDVTWQPTRCFIYIKRGAVIGTSPSCKNKSLSMHLLCRLGRSLSSGIHSTLITLAQCPTLQATNSTQDPPHPHCSLSPFCKLKALLGGWSRKGDELRHLVNVQWAYDHFWPTVTNQRTKEPTRVAAAWVTWVLGATHALPEFHRVWHRHLLRWYRYGWKV